MKLSKFAKIWRSNYTTYGIVALFFLIMTLLQMTGNLSYLMQGQLVPICVYVIMAISLNLTVGILGELSLGHAGFMSVGCFMGAVAASFVADGSELVRLTAAVVAGALAATVVGFLVGLPVLRLNGDYLAIVTLACGEIIKSLFINLYVAKDASGYHVNLFKKTMEVAADDMIIRGPQGIKTANVIENFTLSTVLVLICLFIIFNLVGSRTGRAIMAVRDNKIAARSIGINITKYKMLAFVVSAAMAGAAGAVFGLSQTAVLPGKFNFNTSVLVLVFVVLGGMGNIRGSVIAATLLTVLPEQLRFLHDYRMIIYAIILILVMLARNSTALQDLTSRWKKKFTGLLKKKKKKKTSLNTAEGGKTNG